jgi:AraC-like DNA-binding protein
MPIYMDRHDVSEEVTAEIVAQLHQEDLKVQDEFNCRGLTYWFDDQRKIAFCLLEAPNAEAVNKMHDHAHGKVPHSIIEVDPNLVESFLGRIEDPKTIDESNLNAINEPGFRILFAAKIVFEQLDDEQINQLSHATQDYKGKICKLIENYKGSIVHLDRYEILASFVSVKNAVICANIISETIRDGYLPLKCTIGLDAGNPVSGSKSIFEETIRATKRLSSLKPKVYISSSVQKLCNDEISFLNFKKNQFKMISATELAFLNQLSDFLDAEFSCPELTIESIAKDLGYSKSQFYRNMVNLSGYSPNLYLNKFRLEKSLELLKDGLNSTSETAFLCGFSSPSYFTKCFTKRFGIPPTNYLKAISG